MPDVFLSHQPLLNRQSRIIATRLTLHPAPGATTQDAAHALNALTAVWLQSEKPVFINWPEGTRDAALLDWEMPESATIELSSADLQGAHSPPLLAALQAKQPALCLDFDAQAGQALGLGVQFRFIAFDAQGFTPAQLTSLAIKTKPHGMAVAFNVNSAQEFQACLESGMSAVASWFFMHSTSAKAKTLNPGQAQIVRVLNLVRKNAEIRDVEAALKQDVALSYKLLRYINSVGFGLSCEIQSFRHAVTILGYDKLNKWLSLLLATASKDPMASALMRTALTRARMMELLGEGLLARHEYDNLFITGAFSMLDVLLGVSMDKVLESMHLPEAITDALLGNGGIYAPFLDLAQACETSNGENIGEKSELLGISAAQLNRAQLQALNFADTMEI